MSKIFSKVPVGIRRVFDPLDLTYKAVGAVENAFTPKAPAAAPAEPEAIDTTATPKAPAPVAASATSSGPVRAPVRRRRIAARASTVLTDSASQNLGG